MIQRNIIVWIIPETHMHAVFVFLPEQIEHESWNFVKFDILNQLFWNIFKSNKMRFYYDII